MTRQNTRPKGPKTSTAHKTSRHRAGSANPRTANQHYTSHGPFGLVRGTAHQVIERYEQLAKDAQLAGDIVAAENCLQHVEHYARLLAAAKRAEEARRNEQAQRTRERHKLAKETAENNEPCEGEIASKPKAQGSDCGSTQIQKHSSQRDARMTRLLEAAEAFGKAM